jgi:hypothetical protein
MNSGVLLLSVVLLLPVHGGPGQQPIGPGNTSPEQDISRIGNSCPAEVKGCGCCMYTFVHDAQFILWGLCAMGVWPVRLMQNLISEHSMDLMLSGSMSREVFDWTIAFVIVLSQHART